MQLIGTELTSLTWREGRRGGTQARKGGCSSSLQPLGSITVTQCWGHGILPTLISLAQCHY